MLAGTQLESHGLNWIYKRCMTVTVCWLQTWTNIRHPSKKLTALLLSVDTMAEPTALLVDAPETPAKDLKTYAREAGLELDFDPDTIVAKYAGERDKRLRKDNISQYQTTRSSEYLKGFLTDLYARPNFTREPVKAKYQVVIIGAGNTGIQLVAALRKKGITDVCVIEKGDGVGGTW